MFIDDKKLNVSEMAFEDIVSLGKMGLDSDEDLFANLLCFANPHAFEAVRRSLS